MEINRITNAEKNENNELFVTVGANHKTKKIEVLGIGVTAEQSMLCSSKNEAWSEYKVFKTFRVTENLIQDFYHWIEESVKAISNPKEVSNSLGKSLVMIVYGLWRTAGSNGTEEEEKLIQKEIAEKMEELEAIEDPKEISKYVARILDF